MSQRISGINFTNLFSSISSHAERKRFGNLLAIGIIWLFHVSAIIGIFLGYHDWFLSKTPLNLSISFVLLLIVAPIVSIKQYVAVVIFFLFGIAVEWIGTTTGFPFGSYWYGDNLGPKLDGVPWMIGINWAMLVLITGSISNRFIQNRISRVLFASFLMVFLDFFIEPNASNFDFWHWEGDHIPLSNYIAWFIVSAGLHVIFQQSIRKINFKFSLHLYLAQFTFFLSLYVFYSTI